MLVEFFTVSGWAFWAIFFVLLVFDTVTLSTDSQGWAVAFTSIWLVLVVLLSDAFAGSRIVTLLAALALYLLIGGAWSFWKWYSFLVEKKRAKSTSTQPTAADNAERIVGWMALWPFSMTWWVLTWPRKAFVWLYDRLSTVYDHIATHVWETIK